MYGMNTQLHMSRHLIRLTKLTLMTRFMLRIRHFSNIYKYKPFPYP